MEFDLQKSVVHEVIQNLEFPKMSSHCMPKQLTKEYKFHHLFSAFKSVEGIQLGIFKQLTQKVWNMEGTPSSKKILYLYNILLHGDATLHMANQHGSWRLLSIWAPLKWHLSGKMMPPCCKGASLALVAMIFKEVIYMFIQQMYGNYIET